MSGPYWKVPYSAKNKGQYATIDEVQAALPSDVVGLTVDESLNYPCVQFPEGTKSETMQKVRQHLLDQGFSAVY
ncbi:MAG TPA: hypothetical protein VHV10_16585 [Ktedonobacteraceae bacterium]|jgi:hypothetical protein|nr:hypothetical protein [Ktedonobacteraceae bacterium]